MTAKESAGIEKQYLSTTYKHSVSETEDASSIITNKFEMFQSIADELQLENYEITTREISGYVAGGERYEINIVLAASFTPHEKAFNHYLKKAKADSIHSYIRIENNN